MFSLFFAGVQQDFKLFLLAPIVSAIFRTIFIWHYWPYNGLDGKALPLWHCYRYGFWWGMDFHAYVFLISMVLVSIPGAFWKKYFSIGDKIRAAGVTIYILLLYAAFVGKMLWYYHYHDIYNRLMWLGIHADKKNLLDIFFNENHGIWLLLSFLPIAWLSWRAAKWLLTLPSVDCPIFSGIKKYIFNITFAIGTVIIYYFFHFGGSLFHVDKPEWDEVPVIVKADVFLGKACVDDLSALKMVWKSPLSSTMYHTDEEAINKIDKMLSDEQRARWHKSGNIFDAFKRTAEGAKIKKPQHIFILIGESYSEAPFDDMYADLNLVNEAKKMRADEHTFAIKNFLSAGQISQPSIAGIVAGIYDDGLEINEMKLFWEKTLPTAFPVQLKRLGYRTEFWYGGALNWASLQHFLPAAGFDEIHGAVDFCSGAPRTWLGVYDHIFLGKAAELIAEKNDGNPAVHILYTTSNHGPYTIPTKEYGYDFETVPEAIRKQTKDVKALENRLGCFCYSAKAIDTFVNEMKKRYPDSLFIITGDHAKGSFPIDNSKYARKESSLRERVGTAFFMYHSDLRRDMFAGNTIGGHMNMLPTIIELIAPAGHEYYSIERPLTEHLAITATPLQWLTEKEIGSFDYKFTEPLGEQTEGIVQKKGVNSEAQIIRDGLCELSGYIVRHKDILQERDK